MKYIGASIIVVASAYLEVNGLTDASLVCFMAGLAMAILGSNGN